MTPTQAVDYNTAVAAVLEVYELLGNVVIVAPPPPARGWNAPQQFDDVYERIAFALQQLAGVDPRRLTQAHRAALQRLTDPSRTDPSLLYVGK